MAVESIQFVAFNRNATTGALSFSSCIRDPRATTLKMCTPTTGYLAGPRIATKNTHGTGCSLSSAIAAGLAKGEDMESVARAAKAWISAAIAAADRLGVGHGHGPVHHFHRFY